MEKKRKRFLSRLDDENIGSKYKVLFNDMNNADEQIAPVKMLDGQ